MGDSGREHADRLANILEACGMSKHDVEGDGNCCFSAIAFSISRSTSLLTEEHKEIMKTHGLDLSMDLPNMSITLRQLAVSEWIANSSYYQGFVTHISVEEEARKFLTPGFFHGDLADTMLTSLANALGMPIIVFSSIAYHPIFCITPEKQSISVPLLVAFNQYGAGHYDGVLPKPERTPGPTVSKKVKCSCGKTNRGEQAHCQEIQHKYTTTVRCPCLKNKLGCSLDCSCKNCHNPNGQNITADRPKRKRAKHDWQQVDHHTSLEFAKMKHELLSSGPLTKFEFFLLENILTYCSEEGIDETPENISSIYDSIQTHIQTDPSLPMSTKSIQDITKFLDIHKKNLAVFTALCEMQLQWNLGNELD